MVARLERESRAAPGSYKLKVALLALVGFGLLGALIALAGGGILLIAGLAVAAIFTGGKAIVLLLKLGKLLVLIAAPLWVLLKSSLAALFTRFPAPDGRELTRAEAPRLFDSIDRMRVQMKGPRFHHVLVTTDMNAAVVQRPLLGLFGFPRNYLLLGLPLLESLSPEEALAVVAHEYGHLSGAHAHFGAFIYRLRLTWGSIHEIASQWSGIGGRALRRVIEWYAPFFNAYTFVLARANEYQADAASAELVTPAVTASALKRVNVAAAQYDRFLESVFERVRDSATPPPDIAERWAGHAVSMPEAPLATRWLSDSLNRESSAFDTHPVLRARLEALPGQAALVDSLPAPLQAESAARAWLGDQARSLRDEQQQAWRASVEQGWRRRHEEIRERRERLASLRALTAPTADDTAERLQLQVELEPEHDSVDEVAAFNAAFPDRPAMLYLEATLRLARDEDRGLDLLERVMALDGDATKPACERAFEFLGRQGHSERAETYARRWRDRDAWEARRAAELNVLDPSHDLIAPDLVDAERTAVVASLAANAKGVARAWFARRVLPTDPGVRTYVLVVQTTWWARFRSQGPKIVDRLAAIEWPVHAFICTLDRNKVVGKKARNVDGAQIYGK